MIHQLLSKFKLNLFKIIKNVYFFYLKYSPQSSSFESTANAAPKPKWTVDNFKQLIDTFQIVDYTLFSGH